MSEELDALRRRLYAPDVTTEEVERYRALAGPSTVTEDPPPTPPAPPTPPLPRAAGRGHRSLLGGLATVAVLAVVGVGIAATSRPHPSPAPSPSGSGSTVPLLPSADDGTVALPASARAAFVAALQAGRPAGLLRYFFDHPDALPAQLRTRTRADSDERFGSGAAMVVLSPSATAQKGGRLTVAVTLATVATVQLRALRADSGMQSFIERLGDGTTRAIPGLPMVRTVFYGGEAPTMIEVTVPEGVRWDLVTVFTD